MKLGLSLLGETEICLDGHLVGTLRSEKARALLFFVAVESDISHRRDALAEMFWPEKPEGFGRNSLKQALATIKKALDDRDSQEPYLLANNQEVYFNAGSPYEVDVLEFENLTSIVALHSHRSADTCEPCAKLLEKAVEIYQDDFLSGFCLPDCQAFDEWAIIKREKYKRMVAEAIRCLISYHEGKENIQKACELADRLVALEPWSERSQRVLMRLLAACGKRSAALKQYHACVQILESELGVSPTPETISLFEQIKQWEFAEGPGKKPSNIIEGEEASLNIVEPRLKPRRQPRRWVMGFAFGSLMVLAGFIYTQWLKDNQGALSTIVENTGNTSPVEAIQGEDAAIQMGAQEKNGPEALIALYEATGGENWNRNDGWLTDTSPCEWYGITCSDNNLVELSLPGNNLDGFIPAEIGSLSMLKVLDLRNNLLSGLFPPEIGSLINLTSLNLVGNVHLHGSLPVEIGNLINLEYLVLGVRDEGSCSISGTLPAELGYLTKLVMLEIHNCLIRGSIPPEIGKMLNLEYLLLPGNQLSGSIPAEIFTLTNLEAIVLYGNQYLSGSLPPEIGQLQNLNSLDISYNNFSGTLPEELGNLPNLRQLGLNENLFEGALPLNLIKLNLRSLHLENTDLCEPADPAFQEWFDIPYDLRRTGILCSENNE